MERLFESIGVFLLLLEIIWAIGEQWCLEHPVLRGWSKNAQPKTEKSKFCKSNAI